MKKNKLVTKRRIIIYLILNIILFLFFSTFFVLNYLFIREMVSAILYAFNIVFSFNYIFDYCLILKYMKENKISEIEREQ